MNRAVPFTLGRLLAGFAAVPAQWADQLVSGLSADSRTVQAGDLFFARRGGQRHGLEFLEAARAVRAAAVVWEPPDDGWLPVGDSDLPLLAAPALGRNLGCIASRFYGEPSRQLAVVGITGTDGKTSCAHFIAQALSDAATGPCGLLGTLGGGVYGQTEPSLHTTPDPLAVQRWLGGLTATGRRYAAMEVSSHALDQGRVNGVAFAVAALTHLSRDHLDYHGTVEAYAAAKRRLFVDHQPRWAILNHDDAFGRHLATEAQGCAPIIAYGLGERPQRLERFVWGEQLELTTAGLRMQVRSSWGDGELSTRLSGRFNASNLLAALATLLALEMPLSEALARLAETAPAPGRMERIGGGPDQPLAVIDYAHTPHALEQALTALRTQHGRRLWCVFGCGGDRDAGKRPLMGAIAERLADRVIVTDDNPRTEDPQQIIAAIQAGMRRPDAAIVIRDRRQAITQALAEAGGGDIVLIAGKGHEDYQIIGTERWPFSDRAVAHQFLCPAEEVA
ncbi:MAG: UDP-N-acetylmuramoyl-L-alanyl-D-glutamate--2,6-diaminopimelate ligase [Candidatus Contendobacter sp.]|jgi:UDP-N-acetylmuramoyl-L-alanyl-D-glutamate--2,6-diaminopimelate ligase|nr:UDP-N-acetylmuramoyl-L-alanyl-D-glutamate--2,6-diaminopimelate ligase [Gammaproteobacteria bacterium]MCC8993340.1 UDP-N-acetylmuramoyl-L-alanyl-D-glutamate--2,6-diaminopimelate ligase [Candidatus Contendobacter sp.]